VNEASPHLLDEHLLTFTLRPSCCILAAQKGLKYRDTLLLYPMDKKLPTGQLGLSEMTWEDAKEKYLKLTSRAL
jgi:hypothetical protein